MTQYLLEQQVLPVDGGEKVMLHDFLDVIGAPAEALRRGLVKQAGQQGARRARQRAREAHLLCHYQREQHLVVTVVEGQAAAHLNCYILVITEKNAPNFSQPPGASETMASPNVVRLKVR